MLASVTVTGLLTFTLNLLLDVYTRVVYEVHEIHPCSTETLDIAVLVVYKSAYSCLVLAGHGSLPCEDLVAFPDPPWGLGDRTIRACISAGIQSRVLIIIVREVSHSCDSGQVSKCAVENVMELAIAFPLSQLRYQTL